MIIGTATAADDSVSETNDDVLTVENSTVSENDIVSKLDTVDEDQVSSGESEVLSDESAGTFTELNDLIKENDTIVLDKNYTFNSTIDTDFILGINITKNLIIEGNSHTIDAKNSARIFNIISSNVILNNITFINGRTSGSGNVGGDGAAIWSNGTGSINNCNFINNTAFNNRNGGGGAIWWNGTGTIEQSNFINNSGIGYRAYGGAIHTIGVNITNSKFYNNYINGTGSSYGGAVNLVGNGSIDNCYFINNRGVSYVEGGAVSTSSNCSVLNSYFENNTASKSGAIFMFGNNTLVDNCTFINNSASQNGGAIGAWDEGCNGGLINNSRFISNHANNGGAISATSIFNITNCNFTNNFATNGGSIYGKAKDCTFSNLIIDNSTAKLGSAIYSIAKTGNMVNITCTNSTGNTNPLLHYPTVNEENITLINNNVTLTFLTRIIQSIINGENYINLTQNEELNEESDLLNGIGNFVIDGMGHSLTINNTNGLKIDGNNVTLKNILIKNKKIDTKSNIINCTLDNVGGVIFRGSRIVNSTFVNCKAGSGMYLVTLENAATVDNCDFINCSSNNRGILTVANKNGVYVISNSTFRNCSSTGNQAGIIFYMRESSGSLEVVGCNFEQNNGPSIYHRRGTLNVHNSAFINTTDLVSSENSYNGVTFEDNLINANSSLTLKFGVSGSTINLNSKSLTASYNIINCTLDNVSVVTFKGSRIVNSTFVNCKAGSGMYLVTLENAATVDNCDFINCSSNNRGILTVANKNGVYVISNSTFRNCSSTGNQAGIIFYMRESSGSLEVVGCNFEQNNGPSIYHRRGTLNVHNSAFINTTDLVSSEDSYKGVTFEDNWFGSNNPTIYKGTILIAKFNQTYEKPIPYEWNPILDVYFVKNGTDERVDLPIRPVTYNVTSNNAEVNGELTDDYGKLYTTTLDKVTVKAKVDNQELDELEFGVSNKNGFTELQNLIKYTKDGKTLILTNNYNYNPADDASLINGVVVDKAITIISNGTYISGNNSAKNVFNITSNNVVLENYTIKDVVGTAITSTANNTSINNLKAENVNGNVVDITGDNAIISNIDATGGEGLVVNIVGNYPSVRNISATNRKGDLLSIDGNGTLGSLTIVIGDVTYPELVQANVTANVDGDYIISINGQDYTVTVKDGKGTLTIPDVLDAKQYNATIQSNMTSYDVSANTTFTVNKAKIIDLRISVDNVAYPNNPIAVINTNVDGEYIVNINGKPYTVTVKDGKGNVTLDLLPVDTYTVIVMSNVSNYDVVSNSTSFSIVNGTISELNVIADSVTYPDTGIVLVSASVDGIYNVNVNGTDYPVHVTNGVGNIVLPVLPVGKYNVTVTGKIKNYNLVNKTVLLSVKADTNATVTVPEIVEGRNNTQMPINLPSDAKGNVVLMVDGESVDTKELVNGSAILNIPELTPGEHNISVVYSGDDKYAGFNKTSGIKTKKESNATVNVPTNIEAGKTTTIPIRLPADAKGNVTLMVDGKAVDTKELVNGSAVLTVPAQSAGKHDISVVYSGDDKYATFIKTTNVDVKSPVPAKKATVITAKNKVTFKKSKRSKTKTFKLTLKEKIGGKKLSGKTVLFKLTNVNKIKLTNKVKKAIKKANANYKKAKIAVKKAKGKAAKAKTKKKLAKAKKALTKAKKPQTMLKQLKKGKYAVKTKNGVAKLTLSNKEFVMKKFRGKNIKLTAKFNGDSSYLKSGKTVKVVIK